MPQAANISSSNSAEIQQGLTKVRARIEKAAQAAGRNADDIQLIAVSKTKPLPDLIAAAAAGQKSFGENYAQELADKAEQLEAQWHFIGPLQSNKTKLVANHANWVHSIDRLKIAQRLNQQRLPELAPLNICLQINISDEPQKSGIAPEAALALGQQIQQLTQLRLRGLMCIPKAGDSQAFGRMQQLAQQLRNAGLNIDSLSMGMSNDFEAAIAAGATHVRVGTAIFGQR